MTELEVRSKQGAGAPTYVTNNALNTLRALRDGSAVVTPWKQALVLEGRVFHVTVGALTTPVGAGTTIAIARPMLAVGVPVGLTIIPLRVHVQADQQLIAADNDEIDILLAVDRTQTNTGGAATAEVAFNFRTDILVGSGSNRLSSVFTGDATPAIALDIELAHVMSSADVQGVAATALWDAPELLYEPEVSPVIVGPGTLLEYHAGTAAITAFVQAVWAEFPSSVIV